MDNEKICAVSDLNKKIDREVFLRGWCWKSRGSGKVRFVELRDGSGFVQVVAGVNDLSAENFEALGHLSQESVLEVRGRVVKNSRSVLGVEVLASQVSVLSRTTDYPIGHKAHGTDFLMENRHLWLRSPRQQAILAVRHRVIRSIRNFFDDLGFCLVDAPIFTPNACEGTSTLFETPYFGKTAYLSQSGQLYMEAAAAAVGKAYCFGPTFRAENSNTRRHLTEFWMVEPEVAFLDLAGDMDLAENLVRTIVEDVLKHCSIPLKMLKRNLEPLQAVAKPFTRISYSEALKILESEGVDFSWGDDFGGREESVISARFTTPILVHRYPAAIKAFYMKRDPENDRLSLNVDMLAPEGYGEIIGGGQREEDLNLLEEAIEREKLDRSVFSWYLDLRRFGSIPHAGFGLGVERTVAWICGLPHVRETVPFPRLPGRLEP